MPRESHGYGYIMRLLAAGEDRPLQCVQRHCLSVALAAPAHARPTVLIVYRYPRRKHIASRRLYVCGPCAERFRLSHPEVLDV